jgi:dTMP kinase
MGWHEVARRGVTTQVTKSKFITLEGGEGVGKSTQAALLADALRARGIRVVVTREPGGTAGAEAIRDLLMTGSEDRWSARAETLLFAAARADHVEKVILPALERGDWVICDRFIDSTRAYQGGAGGISDDDIMELHRFGCEGLLPDRTLLIRLPLAVASRRAHERDLGRADRFGARGAAYHGRLTRLFDDIAADDPQRVRVIDATGTVDEVLLRSMAALDDLL